MARRIAQPMLLRAAPSIPARGAPVCDRAYRARILARQGPIRVGPRSHNRAGSGCRQDGPLWYDSGFGEMSIFACGLANPQASVMLFVSRPRRDAQLLIQAR